MSTPPIWSVWAPGCSRRRCGPNGAAHSPSSPPCSPTPVARPRGRRPLRPWSRPRRLPGSSRRGGEARRREGPPCDPRPRRGPAPRGAPPHAAGPGRSGRRTSGLHPSDRRGSVFALVDCPIRDFRLMALWRELKQRLELLPPRLTGVTLRLDRDERRHVIAESAGEPWLEAEHLRAALPGGADVVCWWQPTEGAARVVAGPATGFPATAFEPVNPEMGLLARRWAGDQLGDLRGGVARDLYGGIRDTAVALAARGAQVRSLDPRAQA